uniref:Ig-like domain-containing protein n=1 Tax=Plectus sambesii TaxID=2011161 RepID=A0A914XA67_9BILA
MVLRLTLVLALTIGLVGAVEVPPEKPQENGVGSPALVLEPRNGKTTLKHPTIANNSISLFCGSKKNTEDSTYSEIDRVRWSKFPNPDSTNVLEAKEVTEFEATAPAPNNTVSLNINKPPATAVGKYRCDLWKDNVFMATGNLMVYMRPVFIQEENMRLDVIEGSPFELNGGGYTTVEGGNLSLTCRALGNPEPKYTWEMNGKPIKNGKKFSIRNHVMNISGVSEVDRSEYKCIATNSFTKDGREQTFTSTVTYNVRIKSKLAWLWPLLVIIVTAILLAVIIIACEYRRKKHERNTRDLEPEEDD